ncbi:MAG: hypothetical protein C5B59_05555 [Bacteroidetes bacterium]|nr:MAG: hypothetical protein C5B59_05555 [Bacteroidota bacterium]
MPKSQKRKPVHRLNLIHMREEFEKIEETVAHLKTYVSTKIEEAKLSAADRVSDVLSVFIAKLLTSLLFFLFVLFASTSAAYAIGSKLGRTWLGFLIVALSYLLLGWIVWIARERLLRIPIMNSIIRRLFKDEPEEYEKN